MVFIPASALAPTYDIVVVGSGFGSLFFVEKALRLQPRLRIVMLEWGALKSHDDQLRDERNADIPATSTFRNETDKVWNFTIGYGGGTNCWFGHTPRLHPNDFRTQSLYGVGQDWPLTYDELEKFYCEAEEIMQIAGPDDIATVFPRSRPYPQPPHRLSTPDEMMKRAQPAFHFGLPTARARIATKSRSACCSSARCNLCPVDAKFTVENGFQELTAHPTLSILTGARVTRRDAEGPTIKRAYFEVGDKERSVGAPLFILGANCIHSTAILLSSGLGSALTGVGLNEQVGFQAEVLLDGVDAFDGGTIAAGINVALLDGPSRRDHAGALVYFENRWTFGFRREYGRWRQCLPLTFVVENPPAATNTVTVDSDGSPVVRYQKTDYATRGVAATWAALEKLLAPLPVEAILDRGWRPTESHLLSTLRMGRMPETSVVDANQVHHQLRNLVVVGSSVFPTCPNANPSLTVAALSLRAAERVLGLA
jgi:choline dehydrogenase-like flavoprotein